MFVLYKPVLSVCVFIGFMLIFSWFRAFFAILFWRFSTTLSPCPIYRSFHRPADLFPRVSDDPRCLLKMTSSVFLYYLLLGGTNISIGRIHSAIFANAVSVYRPHPPQQITPKNVDGSGEILSEQMGAGTTASISFGEHAHGLSAAFGRRLRRGAVSATGRSEETGSASSETSEMQELLQKQLDAALVLFRQHVDRGHGDPNPCPAWRALASPEKVESISIPSTSSSSSSEVASNGTSSSAGPHSHMMSAHKTTSSSPASNASNTVQEDRLGMRTSSFLSATPAPRTVLSGSQTVMKQHLNWKMPAAAHPDSPLAVGVLSNAVNRQNRDVIRMTWGRAAVAQNSNKTPSATTANVLFLVAGPWSQIKDEFYSCGDLFWVDMTEGYYKVTFKVQTFLAALSEQIGYSNFQHVLKTDDDSFVSVRQLSTEIEKERETPYWGYMHVDMEVSRDPKSKAYVSPAVFVTRDWADQHGTKKSHNDSHQPQQMRIQIRPRMRIDV